MLDSADTAAASVDTAAPEGLAPPPETEVSAPETAVLDAPETDTPDAPETVLPSLDDLDEETLRSHPKVKDILARESESARRRQENADALKAEERDRDWMRRGEHLDDLTAILRKGVATDEAGELRLDLDRKSIGDFADRMWTANVRASVSTLSSLIDEQLGDTPVTAEEQTKLRDAYAAFVQDPRGGATPFLQSQISLLQRAAVEAAKPALRKEIERELRQEYETRAEADQRKRAEASGRAGASATDVAGAAANQIDTKTVVGIMRAKNAGLITEDASRDYLNKLT